MSRTLLAALAPRFATPSGGTPLTPAQIRTDLLSGLTVALALVPEAVAFAFVAGVHPLVGLYAAFLVGLITAVIGGRPGMISGATGALAVVTLYAEKAFNLACLFLYNAASLNVASRIFWWATKKNRDGVQLAPSC